MATVSSALKSWPDLVLVNLNNDLFASSIRLFLTSHHGLSGAKNTPIASGTGHIHWRAKGRRHAQSPSRPNMDLTTPMPMSCPIPQQQFT
jgi:hypothetical protein